MVLCLREVSVLTSKAPCCNRIPAFSHKEGRMQEGAKPISSLIYSYSGKSLPDARYAPTAMSSTGSHSSVGKEHSIPKKTTHNFSALCALFKHPFLIKSPLWLAESSSNSILFSFFLCFQCFVSLTWADVGYNGLHTLTDSAVRVKDLLYSLTG